MGRTLRQVKRDIFGGREESELFRTESSSKDTKRTISLGRTWILLYLCVYDVVDEGTLKAESSVK